MLTSKNLRIAFVSLLAIAVISTGIWLVVSPVRNSFAQSPTGTPAGPYPMPQVPSSTEAPPSSGQPVPTSTPQTVYRDFFQNALAGHLGTTLDNLKQAYMAAYKDTLDQAVKDGKLTKDQATQLETEFNNHIGQGTANEFFSPFGFHRPRGSGYYWFNHPGMGMGMSKKSMILPSFAKVFNMTETDLMTELQSGKTLAAVAQEKNIDLATLKTNVLSNFKSALDQDVSAGKLTQAQADAIYNQLETNFEPITNKTWTMGKHYRIMP